MISSHSYFSFFSSIIHQSLSSFVFTFSSLFSSLNYLFLSSHSIISFSPLLFFFSFLPTPSLLSFFVAFSLPLSICSFSFSYFLYFFLYFISFLSFIFHDLCFHFFLTVNSVSALIYVMKILQSHLF